MSLLLSMPGGSEWIIIGFLVTIFLIVIPIKAISLNTQNKVLRKQIFQLEEEKNTYLKKLLDKV